MTQRYPSRAHRANRLLSIGAPVLAALLLLVACRPLYLPPVPEAPPYSSGPRIASSEAALDPTGRPRLELEVADVKRPGWLAVQWVTPSGREAASESVWLEPEAEGTTGTSGTPAAPGTPATPGASGAAGEPAAAPAKVSFTLPAEVDLVAGEWRALVSLGGRLLRQFTFVVE